MKKLFILTLICATAFSTQRHATPAGAGAHTGADVSNAWSFAESMYAETADTVNFHAGTYPYVFAPENSGTASQPIVFRSYESDVVTITGASDSNPDMVYFPGSYVELWDVYLITAENVAWDGNYAVSLGGDHNTLHGVNLIKGGDIQTEYLSNNYRTRGINIYGSYNTIDSCWIRGMVESVVLSGGSARYHKIRWNRIHNSALNGIICGGSNDGTTNWMGVLIEGNNIDSCGEDNIQWQEGTDPYSYEKNKGYIVRGNYLARAYENAIDRKGAAFVVVENNTIHTANSDDDGWTNGAEDWGTGPLIERGNPSTLNEYYCLDRGNVMWDGPGGITVSHGGQFINNLMANNRRKLTVSNTSDSTEDALKDINLEGSSTTRSVLNNILIGQPNHSYVWLYNMETSPLDIDNQLYYDSTGTLRFYYRLTSGTSAKVYGLSAWQSRLSTTYTSFTGKDANAISADPLFVDFPFRPYYYNASWDWSLGAGSPAIGAARCWTFASGTGSTSTSLVVDNPYVFTDGFGIVQGDSIDIDGDVRRITSINYSTSTLTLSSGASWSDNDSVWFYVNGARVTNLGPYANVTTVVDTGGDPGGVPSTPVTLMPANGSTRTSPVTFSWNTVSGAVNYWLCISADSWGTLIVDQAAITDTFYTVSLPGGGSYVWNLSASNTYGRSAWSADWTFSTSVASTYRDTLSLSWNTVSHKVTPDTATFIEFTNLQRTGIDVSIDNPGSYEVYWSGVTWKTAAPPTIPVNGAWCRFYRAGGDTVYGAYMNSLGVPASITWAAIVGSVSDNSALSSVLDAKANVDPTGGVSAGTHYSYFRAGTQWKENAILSTRYQEVLDLQDRTLPVVFVGNSLTNQIRPFVLRRIKEQWGFSGLGFDAFGNSGYNGWQSALIKSASWVTYSRQSDAGKWGISGTSLRGFTGDTLLYLPLTGYRMHTDARLWYLKTSGGGTFKLHVDGGTGISINTDDATTQLAAYRISGLDANTNHYFKIDSISVDSVTVYGIETFNSQIHGVAPYFLSVGGSTADEWASHMTFFRAFYDSIAPVMTNIWIGANDAIASTGAAPFMVDVRRILDTLQAIDTVGVTMWTHPAKGNDPVDGNADAAYAALTGIYRDSLLALQASRGISVWDVRNYMPSYEEGVRLNLYSDYIHYTFRGSNYIAQGVMQWLLPTDRRYYGLNRDNSDEWVFGEGATGDSTVNVNGTLGVSGGVGVGGRLSYNYLYHSGLVGTSDYLGASVRLLPYTSDTTAYSYLEARDDNELNNRNLIVRTQDGLGTGNGVSVKEFAFYSSGSFSAPGTISADAFSATGAVIAGTNATVATTLRVGGGTLDSTLTVTGGGHFTRGMNVGGKFYLGGLGSYFEHASGGALSITASGGNGNMVLAANAIYTNPFSTNNTLLSTGGGKVSVGSSTTDSTLRVAGSGHITTNLQVDGKIRAAAIPYYANKSAARSAGLTSGAFYSTVTAAGDTILAIIP